MFVWSGSAWVSVATEVESLANFATQSYADNAPGTRLVVPSSVAVGSGSGSVSTSGTVSFSGASSVSLNNCFSSSYDNYQLIFDFTGTANGSFDLRMRASGADATGSNYARQFTLTTSTTYVGGRASTQSSYAISDIGGSGGAKQSIVTYAFNPNNAVATTFRSFGGFAFDNNTALYIMDTIGNHQLATSYTGFTVSATSGTMTGTVSVYGYKK
jgi:hypothetical protein